MESGRGEESDKGVVSDGVESGQGRGRSLIRGWCLAGEEPDGVESGRGGA